MMLLNQVVTIATRWTDKACFAGPPDATFRAGFSGDGPEKVLAWFHGDGPGGGVRPAVPTAYGGEGFS